MPRLRHLALPAALAGAAALAVAGTAAAAAPALDTAKLGPDGLGPVRIGMTLDQARAATSSKLRVTQRNGACAVLEQVGPYDGVSFLMTDDVIRTATVASTLSVNFTNVTTKGLRLVASEKRVRQLYGTPFFTAGDADSGGRTLLYRPKPKKAPARRYAFIVAPLGHGIIGRYVHAMSVGELPEVRFTEGCS
ncbi:MAG TPA: hypothetical protein VL422_04130 [Miltoncostaea sp.]|nr:hypothetical protein [Miltoncostaea sp.]